MSLLLLSGLWERTRGRIGCVLGTSVIVGVTIVFLDRVSIGWGVHNSGSHWGGNDGRRKGGESEMVMPL